MTTGPFLLKKQKIKKHCHEKNALNSKKLKQLAAAGASSIIWRFTSVDG